MQANTLYRPPCRICPAQAREAHQADLTTSHRRTCIRRVVPHLRPLSSTTTRTRAIPPQVHFCHLTPWVVVVVAAQAGPTTPDCKECPLRFHSPHTRTRRTIHSTPACTRQAATRACHHRATHCTLARRRRTWPFTRLRRSNSNFPTIPAAPPTRPPRLRRLLLRAAVALAATLWTHRTVASLEKDSTQKIPARSDRPRRP